MEIRPNPAGSDCSVDQLKGATCRPSKDDGLRSNGMGTAGRHYLGTTRTKTTPNSASLYRDGHNTTGRLALKGSM